MAGIYSNTAKGAKLEGLRKEVRKIRIEQIRHNIAVADTAIFFHKVHGVQYSDIRTEVELHRQDGFGVRKHRPDFVYKKDGKVICAEIELALKSKDRFENIIKNNFLEYDRQIWIVPDLDSKIAKTLEKNSTIYPNIEIIELSIIQERIEIKND